MNLFHAKQLELIGNFEDHWACHAWVSGKGPAELLPWEQHMQVHVLAPGPGRQAVSQGFTLAGAIHLPVLATGTMLTLDSVGDGHPRDEAAAKPIQVRC